MDKPQVDHPTLVKIDLSQGSFKVLQDCDKDLECDHNTKFQLELIQYGLFSPGFWTRENVLLFYLELVSGVFIRDTLYLFYNKGEEHLFASLMLLLETQVSLYADIKTNWEKRHFIVCLIVRSLCEEYQRQYSELCSPNESTKDMLLVNRLCQIREESRQLSLFKQRVDCFLRTLEDSWNWIKETSGAHTEEKLSEENFVCNSMKQVVTDTIDLLERVEQRCIEWDKKTEKLSGGVKQEYLSFLAPFVYQRFLVCLFTWNALLIECFHSNFFNVETIRGFVTLTVGAPVLALAASLSFAQYYRRRSMPIFAKEDTFFE
jgi:hypothetical protein